MMTAASLLALGIAYRAHSADPAASRPQQAHQAEYDGKIRPLLDKHCLPCHGPANASGGLNLANYKDVPSIQKDQATWRKIITQISERAMPPPGLPQPSAAQRDELVLWLDRTLKNTDESLLPKDPGRVLIRRLSREEYNNTIRDLFGVDTQPADNFPADGGGGGGFDNNADTLFIPPILMERYLEAASEVLDASKPERVFIARPGDGVTPRAAAKKIVAHYATLAFRRPAELSELVPLMGLYDRLEKKGGAFEANVKTVLKAVLVSPHFLFHVERDRDTKDAYPISAYELAGRLSYFLWASMPDAELFKLAGQGKLRDPKVMDAQIKRMIADPKSRAFAESYAGQWLKVKDLFTAAQPDRRRYPEFKPELRNAMYNEAISFFHGVLKNDSSLLDLLDANYTYLNEDLARHYGIQGIIGPHMRRVRLPDGRRGGAVTMASVLTVTSYPQRTSPVLRGKWVLEQVLGTPTPPPPPNAGGLPADDAPKEGLTFRQRLEKHREKPECASCHSRMDPLGFGLENYDAIGRFRDKIGSQPVDSSGEFPTGEKVNGPEEIKKYLLSRKEQYLINMTEKMLSYALGRGLEPYDLPTVRKIVKAVETEEYRSSVLLREIVMSYPFQYRKNR